MVNEAIITSFFSSAGLTNGLLLIMILMVLELEINVRKLFEVHNAKHYTKIAPISIKSLIERGRNSKA